MGSSFIITKSMLEKKGRELMLEFFDSIHDEYSLKTFEEIKSQRKYYDENVVKLYKDLILKDKHLFKDENGKKVTFFTNDLGDILLNPINHKNGYVDFYKEYYKDYKKFDEKDILKLIEDKIKNKTIEIEFVFDFLVKMDKNLKLDSSLEFEINEDLFSLKKAFLNAYELFHHSGNELMD